MITVDDIKQYEEDGMLWVEGAQIVYASVEECWKALTRVIVRSDEISTMGKTEQKANKMDPATPLITQGNKEVVKAIMLKGWISLPITIVISEVQEKRYCRMEITALKQHFSNVDFLIEPKGEMQCHIRYRQGFHYRQSILGWVSKHITLKPREIPETVEIFNTWEKYILGESNGVKVK